MAKKYSEVEVEKALIAAATLGIRPAARQLGIPQATIWQWTQERSGQYAEVREQEASKWRARASAEFEDIVDRLTGLENQAVDKLEQELPTLEGRDAANALKAISTSKGINTQHVHNLRGQPSQVIEHRYELQTVERAIKALESGDVIDVEARELPTTESAP